MPSGVQTCALDRKSTRLNSSHGSISYAVFCLKKKQQKEPRAPALVTTVTSQAAANKEVRHAPHSSTLTVDSRSELLHPIVTVFFFFFNDTATTEIYTFPTRRSSDLVGSTSCPGSSARADLRWFGSSASA